MKENVSIGKNRTGILASPLDSRELIEGAERILPPAPMTDEDVVARRGDRFREADPLGTLPPPLKPQGLAADPVLLDKLGERVAFERTGTRLYDALIGKLEALSEPEQAAVPLEELRRFREEEHQHFGLVAAVLEQLGGDPTAMTPCADASAVASQGIIQVLADPRANLSQSLQAILIAELTDNDGWELLIRLGEEQKLAPEVLDGFRRALAQEEEHLARVRHWLEALLLGTAAPEAGAKRGEKVA